MMMCFCEDCHRLAKHYPFSSLLLSYEILSQILIILFSFVLLNYISLRRLSLMTFFFCFFFCSHFYSLQNNGLQYDDSVSIIDFTIPTEIAFFFLFEQILQKTYYISKRELKCSTVTSCRFALRANSDAEITSAFIFSSQIIDDVVVFGILSYYL